MQDVTGLNNLAPIMDIVIAFIGGTMSLILQNPSMVLTIIAVIVVIKIVKNIIKLLSSVAFIIFICACIQMIGSGNVLNLLK